MYIYKTYFPYIGGEKIPLHYYSLLYQQLDMIWKELISFLKEKGVKHNIDRRNLEIKVADKKLADKILAKLHTSFMIVEGAYEGEYLEHKEYLNYLYEEYSRNLSKSLFDLVEYINRKEYKEAFQAAYKALETIAATENVYMMTGRRLNHMVFEMLHGNIPQTYTNTYLLAVKGSKIVEKIAPRIYLSVAESAYRAALILKANVKIMDRAMKKN